MSAQLFKRKEISEKFYDTPVKNIVRYSWNNVYTGFHVGMELEVENCVGLSDVAHIAKHWVTHQDGSLRNNGLEFVSGRPQNYEQALEALSDLEKFLEANNHLSFSDRTSFHIHMNIQDFTFRQFHSFLCLYYTLESLLVQRAGSEKRVGNHFCLRAEDANSVKHNILTSIKFDALDGIFRQERYLAMNLNAFPKFGTLEFRAHRGTSDVSEYVALLNCLKELYDFAKGLQSPLEIYQGMSSEGFLEYFENSLPITMEYISKEFDRDSALENICREMIFGQALAHAFVVNKDKKEEAELPKKKIPFPSSSWTRTVNLSGPIEDLMIQTDTGL